MRSLDFALIVKHLLRSGVSCAYYIIWIVWHKKISVSKRQILLLIVICSVLVEVLNISHELGHIVAAEEFGYRAVQFGRDWMGYNILIDPPISEAPPFAQTVISLAGPAVDLIASVLLFTILRRTRSKLGTIVALYLFYIAAFGVASLLFPFSGDARNFFQGLAKILEMDLEKIALLSPLGLGVLSFTAGLILWRVYRDL